MSIQVYTDGSCKPNPGPGGWAWLWFKKKDPKVIFTGSGGEKQSTNNRMELLAVIKVLKNLKPFNCLDHVELFSDSQYVVKTLLTGGSGTLKFSPLGKPLYTGYAKRWIFPSSTRKNAKLWNILHQELQDWADKDVKLSFHWVKGHSTSEGNALADKLANEAVPKI